jgi:hypothetical protein
MNQEHDPEAELRELWTRKGIPKSVQDGLIADVEKKAAPGARVGPWTIPERGEKTS